MPYIFLFFRNKCSITRYIQFSRVKNLRENQLFFIWNRDGVFGIMTGDPGRKNGFCLLQNSQTGPAAHPASSYCSE
jgi:hypothetical protein